MQLIRDIKLIFSNYSVNIRYLLQVSDIQVHVLEAAMFGADVVTLPPAVLGKMLKHPLTDSGIEAFLADWKKISRRQMNRLL